MEPGRDRCRWLLHEDDTLTLDETLFLRDIFERDVPIGRKSLWHESRPLTEAEKARLVEIQRRVNRQAQSRASSKRRNERLRSAEGNRNYRRLQPLLLEAQDNCCYFCGECIDETCTVDHLTPVARGGNHLISNLAAVCNDCNAAKYDRTEAEFWELLRKQRSRAWVASQRKRALLACPVMTWLLCVGTLLIFN